MAAPVYLLVVLVLLALAAALCMRIAGAMRRHVPARRGAYSTVADRYGGEAFSTGTIHDAAASWACDSRVEQTACSDGEAGHDGDTGSSDCSGDGGGGGD